MRLVDRYRRPLHDLRVSVTDRCNFRCTYCMPREHFDADHAFLEREALLTYEEITTVVQSLMPAGLRKVRLTGGEPLLRKDITTLVEMLRAAGPELDLALTTNGALLERHASALKQAGLDRVTVSLDAIDEALFQQMADTTNHGPNQVLAGIDVALGLGLGVKVNTVVQKGLNDGELIQLAEACTARNITLRFIEFMDVGNTNAWKLEDVMTGQEIRNVLQHRFGQLKPVQAADRSQVARTYETVDGHRFGFIESVSNPFCGDCTRARLSANGSLYTCLFSSSGHDLKALLRMEAEEHEVLQAIHSIWEGRKDRYSMDRASIKDPSSKVEMSFIGG